MRKLISTLSAGLVAVAAGGWATILPASAANVSATCATIGAALTNAASGDVITLDSSAAPGGLCHGAFTIKTGSQVTLQGNAPADGFDGQGVNQILTGSGNGATIIQGLTFRNGHATSGGAISLLDNVSPTIRNSVFTGNTATSEGGAVELVGTAANDSATITGNVFGGSPTLGNTAFFAGGAVQVNMNLKVAIGNNQFVDNTVTSTNAGAGGGGIAAGASSVAADALSFTGNTLTGNSSGGDGGGALITVTGGVTITGNTFRANVLMGGQNDNQTGNGGGLGAKTFGSDANARIVQSGNLFDSNVVHAQTFVANGGATPFDFGGGGEFAVSKAVASTDDTFTRNQVDAGGGGNTAVGGAFGLQGDSGRTTTLTASNLVAVNNSVGAGGEGGAVYAGFDANCSSPPCTAEADVFDSTLTANSVGAGGTGQEMDGAATDTARVVNSIVTGPIGAQTDVAGFGTIAINHSDACVNGAAAAGAGNICADPRLANVAGNDVHETAASPTIDKGDNAQVLAGLTMDYLGDPRIAGTSVDMGADEFEGAVVVPKLPAAGHAGAPALGGGLAWLGVGMLLAIALAATGRARRRSAP